MTVNVQVRAVVLRVEGLERRFTSLLNEVGNPDKVEAKLEEILVSPDPR